MIEAPRQFEPKNLEQAAVFTVDIQGSSIELPIIPAHNPLHPNLPRYGVPGVAGPNVWGSISPDGRYLVQSYKPLSSKIDIDPKHPSALVHPQSTSLSYSLDQAPDSVVTSTLAQVTTERLRLASLEQKQGLANNGRRTRDPLTGDYLDNAINKTNKTLGVVLPEASRRATAEAQMTSPYAADQADQIAFQQRVVLANSTGPEAADAQKQLARELSVPLMGPLLKLGEKHPKLARALVASSVFLSACGGAGQKPPEPTRPPAVTLFPTATAILPTEAPPTATPTAIPPSPIAAGTPTQEAKPSATPIPLIEFARVDDMTAQLKLFAGSPAGKALEVALADRAKDLKPLVVTTASGKTAYPGYSTGIVQLGIPGTQSPDFNPENSHLGFAREANQGGDIRIIFPSINEKDTSFTLDPKDPTKLQLVSLKFDSSGLELRMPQEFVAQGGHTFGINGATGHVTIINRDGVVVRQVYLFGIDGRRPDWKSPPETTDSPPKTATSTPVVGGSVFTGTPSAIGTPGSGEGGATPGATGTPNVEKTPTATATATPAAETVKPTGAYKEVNGSIVWTSFENARDTITPPTIPGLKAQLKGETVIYVDAAGKEVGQFNPEVTFSENGAVKRLGAVLFDRDSQKLKDAIGDKMPFPFPLNVRVRMKNLVTKQGTPMTLYGCDGQIDAKNLYAGQTNRMTFATTSIGFTYFNKENDRAGVLALAQLGFPVQAETQWNIDSMSPEQLAKIQALCNGKIDETAAMFRGIEPRELAGFNAQFRYADLLQGAKFKSDFLPYSKLGESFVGAR